MFARRAAMLLAVVAIALPRQAHGQRTQLQVTGSPIAFTSPTATDYAAGFIQSAGSLAFSVNAQTGTTGQRTTSVYIRCAAPCPATGSKPVNTLQWQRADLSGVWNTLTTADALVETRAVFKGGTNDPWSNSILFRFTLGWTTDQANATANTYNIIMTLTVTVP